MKHSIELIRTGGYIATLEGLIMYTFSWFHITLPAVLTWGWYIIALSIYMYGFLEYLEDKLKSRKEGMHERKEN